jgi:hypothetical protein
MIGSVDKKILIGAGVLGVAALAVYGIAKAAKRELLPTLAPDHRQALLSALARMRPIQATVSVPGGDPERTTAVELRPTPPGSWDESALAWVERMNRDGYAVAFWEGDDAIHAVLTAFTDAEEKGLATYAHDGSKAGWVMLLLPRTFDHALEGQSKQDLLNGVVRKPALVADLQAHESEPGGGGGGFATYADEKDKLALSLLDEVKVPYESEIAFARPFAKEGQPFAANLVDGQRVTFLVQNKKTERPESNLEGVYRGKDPETYTYNVVVDRIADRSYQDFKYGLYKVPYSEVHKGYTSADLNKYYDRLSHVEWTVLTPGVMTGTATFGAPPTIDAGDKLTLALEDAFGNKVIAVAQAKTSSDADGIFTAVPLYVQKVVTDKGTGPIRLDGKTTFEAFTSKLVDPKSMKSA